MKTQAILDQIGRITAPDEMSQREALDFMEELVSELEIRCEALRGEMGDE